MERLGDLVSVGVNWSEASDLNPVTFDEELRVVGFHDPPYLSMTQTADGGYEYSGYLFDLWTLLASFLNLRYRMVEPLDWGYGNVRPNGTWSGMVGELVYGRGDIALTWLMNRADRAAVVNYVYVPIGFELSNFHVLAGSDDIPRTTPEMLNSLLKPLHVHVWWVLLAALFATSAALRIAIYFNQNLAERREDATKMTLGSCLFYSYMSLVGQGWDIVPRSLAARIITMCSWMASIIVVTSYTANLISDKTALSVDKPIGSLKEFTEQAGWKLAMQPGYGVVNDWQKSSNKYERELYRRITNKDGIVELNDVSTLRFSVQPKTMTFIDIRVLKFAVGDDACSLVPLLNQPPKLTPNYFVIAKGRPALRKMMFDTLLKFSEAGILSFLKHRWFDSINSLCPLSSEVKLRDMSSSSTVASILLVPLGVAVSLVIFLLEYVWSRRFGKRANYVKRHGI